MSFIVPLYSRPNWPAQSSFPRFVSNLHRAFANATGQGYADKDVMLPFNLEFERDPVSGYARLHRFDVVIQRFNERAWYRDPIDRAGQPVQRVVVTFDWDREMATFEPL